MLTNAVSSAVGRLYASAAAVEPRQLVQRVDAVARVSTTTAGTTPADGRTEREHAEQRSALAQGVRLVFESVQGTQGVPGSDAGAAALSEPDGAVNDSSASTSEPADQTPPDPNLEEAILRFIHAVFRSIAEAEGDPAAASPVAAIPADTGGPAPDPSGPDAKAAHPAFNHSREVLGRRIEALAERLKLGGDEADLLADDALTGDTSSELKQSFADVLRALGVRFGPAVALSDAEQPTAPTRGNLVQLMHKLAHAMQGSPPVDEGLPTVGGLLHARA